MESGLSIRYSSTCKVKNERNNKEVDASVSGFSEKKTLDVVVNQSVKLHMVWNGRFYEGRAAGIDFVSDGPTITKINDSLRGKNK